MENKNAPTAPSDMPEFTRILDKFNFELARQEELVSTIATKVASLTEFEKNEVTEKSKGQSNTLVGELAVRLDKLHDLNNSLEEIHHNLTKSVG